MTSFDRLSTLPRPQNHVVFALSLAALVVLLGPRPVNGQSTLFSEDFEALSEGDTAPGDGSWSIDVTNADVDGYFEVRNVSGDLVFGGSNLEGEAIWKTAVIDASAYPQIDFSLTLSHVGEMEESDYVDVAYSTDGGTTFQTLKDWNGEGNSEHTLTGNWSSQTISKSGVSGNSFVLRVAMDNAANAEKHRLDDVTVTGRGATAVQFTKSSGTVNEERGATNLSVEILSPPSGTSVSADVVFNSGSSTASSGDVSNFGTKSVTFSSGASDGDTRSLRVSLAGDGEAEGTETAIFDLQNVSGGSATVGSPSEFDLTIQDAVSDHSGDVLFTEIMPDPDAVGDGDGEYIELYNATSSDIDADAWSIDVGDHDPDDLSGVTIPARGFAVLCVDDNPSENGGIQNCDLDYRDDISLNQGGETMTLRDGGNNSVDVVTYSDSDPWPDPTGASMVFTGTSDNNVGSNWATASRRERGFALDQNGDAGSPGRSGDQQVLQPSTDVTGSAGWRLLSAPMGQVNPDTLAQSNLVQGVSGHYPGAQANLYRWPGGRASSVDWTVPSTKTTDLTTGARGFLWYVFDTPGAPETDPPPFSLSLPGVSRTSTVDATGLGEGFYLLGNPYAQSYDLSDLDLPGKNFSTTVQVWDPSAGSYVDVTRAPDASDLIGPYQGFFVERSSGTAERTLQFSPSGRRADPVPLKRAERGPTRIAFQLTGYAADSVVTRDEALTLRARPEASAGWDVYDASKLTPLSSRYVTAAFPGRRDGDTVLRAVASIPTPLSQDSVGVPIRLTTKNAQEVERLELSWPSWDRVPDPWALHLRDMVADSTINLRRHDTYSFVLQTPGKYRVEAVHYGNRVDVATTPTPLPEALEGNAEAGSSRFLLAITASTIPVELTGIDASVSNNRATLRWTTSSETNNAGFYVEHRSSGRGTYADLGFVEGAGTTAQSQRYTYRTGRLAAGRHSFRLRQIDTDGTATRTAPIAVDIPLERAAEMHVNPSPVRSRAIIELHVRSPQDVTIRLFDAMGRTLRTVTQGEASAGRMHRYRIDAESLASGLYFVRAVGEDFRQTRRMVVVR